MQELLGHVELRFKVLGGHPTGASCPHHAEEMVWGRARAATASPRAHKHGLAGENK